MFSSEEEKKGIFEQGVKMNFEETLKAQRIIIAIALILMSLVSFNFALKGTYTIIALIVGFAFLGMAFFLLFRLKKI
jgi:heme O synthase-like polyprenyltransferase